MIGRKAKKPPVPTKAIVGFVELGTRKDAIAFARDAAKHFFVSTEDARVCVLPYDGGFVYEAHEAGGKGGHLTSALRILASGKETAWFPVYRKIVQISIRDGRPLGLVLPKEQSTEIMQDFPDCRATPGDRMIDVVDKGETVMTAGLAMAICGGLSMFGALTYDFATRPSTAVVPTVEFADLPSRQWALVGDTPIGLFVESLKYDASREPDRRWTVSRRPVEKTASIAADAPLPVSDTPQLQEGVAR